MPSSPVIAIVGFSLPLLGLGVYENYDCYDSCIAAFEEGYRWAKTSYRHFDNVPRLIVVI